MKKISLTIMAIICALFSGICNAEPDSTFKYLMNEPLTLLDWGIYQMQKSLENEIGDKLNWDGNEYELRQEVHYNWKGNEIIVFGVLGDEKEFDSKSTAKVVCERMIDKYRSHFSVDPATGKLADWPPYNYLDGFFTHTSPIQRGSQPKNLNDKLYHATEIEVAVRFKGSGNAYVECKGPLLSKDIYFKE